MLKYKITFITIVVLLAVRPAMSGETWRLDKGQDWKSVSADSNDKYLSAVAEIKQLANTGQTGKVAKALKKLKKDFPEVAGPDLDVFIEAEVLYSKGNFVKAIRSYDKLLEKYPESTLYEAALDREFAIATAFLAGQKKPVLKIFKIKGYAEGEKIMERITNRAGDSPVAVRAAVSVAASLEKREKFSEAYDKWSEISSKWPTGEIGKEALLAMARCKHASYRGPKYDYSCLLSAKTYYENFKARYPQDANSLEIDKRITQITEQIAYKQFAVGKYYTKTNNKEAANLYYQMVINGWPESIGAKMAERAMNAGDTNKKEDESWKKKIIRKCEQLFL
jgi:outer membrane protein assembly factor BamD (BamD/ComL family)